MAYQIITDSSADIPWSYYSERNINMVALTVNMDGTESEDNESVDAKAFYSKLKAGSIATTSQVSVAAFLEAFARVLEQGNDVFYVGLSSGLSGTYQSACIARDELSARYPGRRIYVAHSTSVTLGLGIMLLTLCDMRDEGKSFDELISFFEGNIVRTHHLFTVDDLMFLMRGGRVSRASAMVGSLLGIKPMLHVSPDGKLIPHGKVRGRKASLDGLVSEMKALTEGNELEYVGISHGDCEEDAEYVMKKIQESYTVKKPLIRILGPTVGAHSGPGTVALFFFGVPRV